MNEDFIRIKSLEGDLKLSHKKRDFGITVSTEEVVYQKPHANYHLRLEDIVSIIPFDTSDMKTITFNNRKHTGSERMNMSAGMPHYLIDVRKAVVHNRSGIFQLGSVQFILPIHRDLLLAISKYGGLSAVI
ncbi:hypothetical protein N0M98_17775 [Paenibacillus doosanensis]|uniref:Uncharacterized protein n=1 Tax=Paenibacillus konkukensis TaxID=2020716 RepID=A0ABY4RJE4_9BACL|nr:MULTISPECIES: hypothetical protein [Paenibacillus]MCS7461990.1 hypothetical protein [Paenibacillus doosanensis]UQZ81502.1 hypothetical protein SK3146_00658 [Paenibacillus konkukensis]